MITRVKGTQDFLDLRLYNFITDTIRNHLHLYNFQEIATPIIESVELFVRAIGEHTDIVSKEMFLIPTKGEEMLCLRPEATAAVVRAFIENNIQSIPWKTFLIGPMFRYERPQKGRYRQFHQTSIEIIGSASVAQDAFFIAMLDQLFRNRFLLGTTYSILLNFLGCFQDRVQFKKSLADFLNKYDTAICVLCKERKTKNILRIFDCKNTQCQECYQKAPQLTDSLCETCSLEWQQLKGVLKLLSISFVHQPTLVRGLDYYNKTVFEFVSSNLGAQHAFCGGGHYDQLVKDIGGKEDQPSFGAAIGLERLMLLLEPMVDKLSLPQQQALHVILPIGKEQQGVALLLAQLLIGSGLTTEVFLDDASVKSMMRKVNKLGARYAIIIGENEIANQEVTVKNMMTGQEERISQQNIVVYLKANSQKPSSNLN